MAAVVGWTSAVPAAASSGGGRRITDTANNRTVYLVCIALVALAAALAVFTWWFWRNTRRDPEALGPLEVMGERDYVDGDPTVRQTLLDANRPVGAAPVLVGATDPLLVEPDVEPPAAPERPLEPATATTDAFADNGGIDPALGEQTKLLEVAPSAPAATGDDATTAIAVVGNGSHPIDPGLPRTVDDTGGTQLSLAELASLDPGFQQPFDPDALTTTPSTGIPVTESADAWVEREVAAAAGNGSSNGSTASAPAADEPALAPDAAAEPAPDAAAEPDETAAVVAEPE